MAWDYDRETGDVAELQFLGFGSIFEPNRLLQVELSLGSEWSGVLSNQLIDFS